MTHGTRVTYRGGCGCAPCRAANAEYERMRVARRRAPVDMAEVRDHVAFLRSRGMTDCSIEVAAGVGRNAIDNIMGRGGGCRHQTADAILSVTAQDVGPRGWVPARHAQALLQSMVDSGLTPKQINACCGVGRDWAYQTRVQHHHVAGKTYRRVRVLYELLARQGIVPASVLEEVS